MLIIDVIYSYLGIWIRVYYLLTKKFYEMPLNCYGREWS